MNRTALRSLITQSSRPCIARFNLPHLGFAAGHLRFAWCRADPASPQVALLQLTRLRELGIHLD